jgi:hypothetical protein
MRASARPSARADTLHGRACAPVCLRRQAVRATSAAPYYFDDYLTTDSLRFQDGATTCNNPAVVALQQARLLHPQVRGAGGRCVRSVSGRCVTSSCC